MSRILFGTLDERCQGERLGLDPLTVGLLVGEPVLDFVVIEHATLFRVDHEHLSRSEATRNEDLCRVDVEHARLARQDEAIVGGHTIAGGTQTITVDDRAQHRSVRKRDCGRALPRLGEHRLVLIPGAALGGEHLVLVPRLGKQHRHGTYERAAVHGDELEHVVEHGRVGTLAVEDGQDLLEICPHDRRVQMRLAGPCPVDVATQRVDLAVMDHVALGMGALPRRRRVRGVARVDERDGRIGHRVIEVAEEAAHLRGDEHALVDDRTRTHRADVEDLAVERRRVTCALLDSATANVELALEIVARFDTRRAPHERLLDDGHALERRRAQVTAVDGNVAPEQQRDALGRATVLEDAHALGEPFGIRGQKEHGDAIFPLVGKEASAFLRLLAKEAVRYLDENARAVTGVGLEAHAAAVLEIDEHGQGIVNNLVRTHALEVGQGPDAAGIVFELASIHRWLGVRAAPGSVSHLALHTHTSSSW